MQGLKTAISILLVLFCISACEGGGEAKIEKTETHKKVNVSGAVEKGPFIIGSTVTINTLSEQGDNTDSTIVTNTTDDLGNFKFFIESQTLLQISSTGHL